MLSLLKRNRDAFGQKNKGEKEHNRQKRVRRLRPNSDLALWYPLASSILLCPLFSCWATFLSPEGAALSSLLSGVVFESVPMACPGWRWGGGRHLGGHVPSDASVVKQWGSVFVERLFTRGFLRQSVWSPLFHPLERRLEEVMVYSTLTRLKRHSVWLWYFLFNAVTNYRFCPLFPD